MEVGTTVIFSTFSLKSTMDEEALSAEWSEWASNCGLASAAGREFCSDSLSAWSGGEEGGNSSQCLHFIVSGGHTNL